MRGIKSGRTKPSLQADRRLHTQTLHSHVSPGGAVFDCYIRGCVCIGNKIVL